MSELQQSTSAARSVARQYAFWGAVFGLFFPVLATVIYLAASRLPPTWASIVLAQSQPLMWVIDTAPLFLGALAALAGHRQDTVESDRRILAQQASELRATRQDLEARVAERTRQLDDRQQTIRRALQTTRQLSPIRDVAELAGSAVRLIAQIMTEHIVDLYLLDERRAEVIRAATSGGADPSPLSFALGDPGAVGQAAALGETAIVSSAEAGQEIAVPLLARGRPLGVLHFRPAVPSASPQVDLEVVQLLADQLAHAIETSRLFEQAHGAFEQLQALSGRATQTAWRDQSAGPALAFEFSPAGTRPSTRVSDDDDPRTLRLPLDLRGQRIGSISLRRGSSEAWSQADRDFVAKTASQVALALENVRLLEETRERALQEQRLGEFSAKLSQSVDLDSLLQTAVREIAALPEISEASIYLSPASPEPTGDSA